MANVKISNLTAASTPLAGTEVLPVVQSGTTVKASIANVQTATYSGGTANGVAYLNGSKVLTTGSALVFDGTNLGLGAPSAWGGSYKALQANRASLSSVGGTVFLGANFYNNGTSSTYIATDFASLYGMADGQHRFYNAPAGTAGNAITFTQAMTLNASGQLGIGTTSPTNPLHIVSNTLSQLNVAASSGNTNAQINLEPTGTGIALIGPANNVAFAFRTNATEGMRLDANQNLGIGQTSIPSFARLAVTGTAGAQTEAKQQITISAPTTTVGEGAGIRLNAASGAKEAVGVIGVVNNATGSHGSMTFGVYNGGANIPEWMRISNAGIVTMSAYGVGTATFSAAGVISSVSDETWKIKDGVPVDPDAMLNKLEPGYWFYNDEKKETFGVDRQLGFYAQNVNAAIGPEAAPEPEEGKPWGYYDRSVLAVTVMSLQKALATIETLTARITALESA
jgi:hypothetical protein